MPKVVVSIFDDGSVRPDFFGFEGNACLKVDQQLHARLAQFGIVLDEVQITPKPELLLVEGEKQAQRQRQLQEPNVQGGMK
ncbi:hypothetical protein [Ktedonospora formicarum]|uniref:Uncharacterized protein n=1 Tax=Ktedonospora formicarum TaxID=2778364 RepID=A0A8J3IDP6_9CHLR|nr:hypothetical protein [Ktedonospora formicarum]GHO50857.1 hypothetical protein KSX_90200 [Ktedonospora formicarum]